MRQARSWFVHKIVPALCFFFDGRERVGSERVMADLRADNDRLRDQVASLEARLTGAVARITYLETERAS